MGVHFETERCRPIDEDKQQGHRPRERGRLGVNGFRIDTGSWDCIGIAVPCPQDPLRQSGQRLAFVSEEAMAPSRVGRSHRAASAPASACR